MANGTVRKAFLFFIVSMVLLALPGAHLLMGQADLSTEEPLQLLTRYLQATYARD